MLLPRWLMVAGLVFAAAPGASAQSPSGAKPAAAAHQGSDAAWPKSLDAGGIKFTVHQPQPISWDGYRLIASAAIVAKPNGQDEQVFGSAQLEATTLVNKDDRTVRLERIDVTKVRFPSVKESEARYQKLLNDAAHRPNATIHVLELDRLESSLGIVAVRDQAEQKVKNDAPRIVFATDPTLLIFIDGTAVWRPVAQTTLQRVINTRPLLLRDSTGTIFLKIFNGWLQAPAFDGAWSVTLHPSPELELALKQALEARTVDPLTGTSPDDEKATPPSLGVNPPRILIATAPTELIVTQGSPKYVPLEGTNLLYVENTTGNVFRYNADQQLYVLIAGRWFKASSERGPWQFVASEQLPPDFRRIPDDSAKENVKASVAGTPQAEEAVIANRVPQSAKVDRKATLSPTIDGEARFEPIEGTPLHRVVNCATPIVRVDDTHFYAVENGVWFTSAAVTGPWVVATSIPVAIYSIPVSSPIYYVTYVRVYEVTPTSVVVGYMPGYYGTYVSDGVVVYGTGYYYTPWVGTVWYGPPVTYGFGVGMAYTPWTGWAFTFGFGWCWGHATMSYGGWGWGPYPWWGPVGIGFYAPGHYPWRYRAGAGAVWGPRPGSGAVWGPGGWAASTGNVYHRWGAKTAVTRSSAGYDAWTGNSWSREVGRSYNSRTGTLSAGQRSSVANIYTGNYSASASGSAVNVRTGGAVAGGKVTHGNAYTGNQVTAGAAAARNPNTGKVTTAAGVKGEKGGVARVGDDLYVSHDGNVARRDEDGNWQEHDANGAWKKADAPAAADLDRSQQSREKGGQRAQGYTKGAHRAAGFSGRRR